MSSIDNLDNLSPVGYTRLVLTNCERNVLHSVDRILHNLMGDYFLRYSDDKLVNCVVLAHYLRAQVCNKLKGFESIKKYINTVNNIEKALLKVFKREDRAYGWYVNMVDMLSHTKRLLEKFAITTYESKSGSQAVPWEWYSNEEFCWVCRNVYHFVVLQ